MASFFLSCIGCSGATKSVEKYAGVTVQNFNKTCGEPEEFYDVPSLRFPIPAQVIRDKGCMGIKDILTVAFPGEATEKNLTAAKLLMLMYIEHQSSELTGTLLKTDKTVTSSGMIVHMAFYELKKVVKETAE